MSNQLPGSLLYPSCVLGINPTIFCFPQCHACRSFFVYSFFFFPIPPLSPLCLFEWESKVVRRHWRSRSLSRASIFVYSRARALPRPVASSILQRHVLHNPTSWFSTQMHVPFMGIMLIKPVNQSSFFFLTMYIEYLN